MHLIKRNFDFVIRFMQAACVRKTDSSKVVADFSLALAGLALVGRRRKV